MNKNIKLLYGFSFFDPFMIVIALWVPYLATQGISMFSIAFVFLLLPLILREPARAKAI